MVKKEPSQMVKKELSIEEIERQALLELPDRKLMSLLQSSPGGGGGGNGGGGASGNFGPGGCGLGGSDSGSGGCGRPPH